jgi:hypothetical protein
MSLDTTEDYGPDMQQFVCSVCEEKHYDINHYFKGTVSTKCLWCAKYSKVKPKPVTKEGEVT